MRTSTAVACALAALASCLPAVKGPYRCAVSTDCPSGMTCEEDRCVAGPLADAVTDAAVDAPPDPSGESQADQGEVVAWNPERVCAGDACGPCAGDPPAECPPGAGFYCAAGRCIQKGSGAVDGEVITFSSTGLEWTREGLGLKPWPEADAACRDLKLAGHDDWRLPTIAELRSLVVACPAAALGGECPVDDWCSTDEACWSPACEGCGDIKDRSGNPIPAIDPGFLDPSELMWSATPVVFWTTPAYFGLRGSDGSIYPHEVRDAESGQPIAEPTYCVRVIPDWKPSMAAGR